MSYKVIVTDSFKRDTKHLQKKYNSAKSDIFNLIELLEENPLQGSSLGKNCYKIRMAISSKGKGKSGGARIVTCVKVVNTTVFLLSIYDKSEKESFTEEELDAMIELATEL